ncbi:MAG: MinD/ParA family ATP-binding protein [Acidiferrobacterales bacterium]
MAVLRERGNKDARQRLADISQYFLSEPAAVTTEKPATQKVTQLLPVLVDSELTQIFVYALARALHARGITALVLHVESGLRNSDPRSSALCSQLDSPASLRRHLEDGLGGTKPPPQVCLIPVANPVNPHLREYGCAVMAIRPSPDGLKHAYLTIKQLALRQIPIRINVIVVGTTKEAEGRQYYDRLAAGAMRFLGRTLGYIGSVTMPESESASSLGASAPDFLVDIVDVLVRDGLLADSAGRPVSPDGQQAR